MGSTEYPFMGERHAEPSEVSHAPQDMVCQSMRFFACGLRMVRQSRVYVDYPSPWSQGHRSRQYPGQERVAVFRRAGSI